MNAKIAKALKIIFFVMLWALALGYLIFAQRIVDRRAKAQAIQSVNIHIVDSSSYGNLISTKLVEKWIAQSKIKTIGTRSDSIELQRIKSIIERNSFIQSANLYTTYNGELCIEVDARTAALRFMVDGYNKYLTPSGYIFDVPLASSLYVPVVTGSYKPIFPCDYEGSIEDYLAAQRQKIAEKIEKIKRDEKYPLLRDERTNAENERLRRKMFIDKDFGESDEAFARRVKALRAKKEQLRKHYISLSREIEAKIAKVDARIEAERRGEKKLIKNCDDLLKLINFAQRLEKDPFWRAEVVQIIISEGSTGDMRIEIIPRSGNFKVTLGDMNELDTKLAKLYAFYTTALNRVGWDRYKSINVEFKNQVVCK